MEVEQRIGRLDRIGQQANVIRIVNFSIKGTIEERIFERLYERIGVFERSIGELEQIIGEEVSLLTKERPQQVADARRGGSSRRDIVEGDRNRTT